MVFFGGVGVPVSGSAPVGFSSVHVSGSGSVSAPLVCSVRVWWCAGVFRGRVRCLVFRGVLWWWGGGRGLLVWVG